MERAGIKKRIEKAVRDHKWANPGEPVEDFHCFVSDYGMDSLDLVELVMDVEREFGITVSDYEFEHLLTVKSLVDCVELKIYENGKKGN
jgi:acyl carrier protein